MLETPGISSLFMSTYFTMLVLGIDIGIVNMAACLADVQEGSPPVVINCINLRIGHPKDSINLLIKGLVRELHYHAATLQADRLESVEIEQQLGRVATKNYALSSALLMFYESLSVQRGGAITVASQNPRVKFKKLAQLSLPCLDVLRTELTSSKGRALKKLSVRAAHLLAEEWQCQVYLDKEKTIKKLDDAADAYLMAVL